LFFNNKTPSLISSTSKKFCVAESAMFYLVFNSIDVFDFLS
jgi:hypothetical protein